MPTHEIPLLSTESHLPALIADRILLRDFLRVNGPTPTLTLRRQLPFGPLRLRTLLAQEWFTRVGSNYQLTETIQEKS